MTVTGQDVLREWLTGKDLTDRERDVLVAYAAGLTRTQVANRLHVTENTVKTHLQRIAAKYGTANTRVTGLVAMAIRVGDIP